MLVAQCSFCNIPRKMLSDTGIGLLTCVKQTRSIGTLCVSRTFEDLCYYSDILLNQEGKKCHTLLLLVLTYSLSEHLLLALEGFFASQGRFLWFRGCYPVELKFPSLNSTGGSTSISRHLSLCLGLNICKALEMKHYGMLTLDCSLNKTRVKLFSAFRHFIIPNYC